ncbi:MAG: hypothetical protein ACK4K7_02980 [Allosphingosinicella sp.]|uniref:hypothetical protein n=1 Tax=Allosphingosinicella sp. TaxID=2823234 RepID=UPI0039358434
MSGRVSRAVAAAAGATVRAVRGVCDRFWLFTIAAIALVIIGFILGAVVIKGGMPAGAGELFASAITGLLLVVQKVIDAQQQRRMADQLARSSPPGPQDVHVVNDDEDRVPVSPPGGDPRGREE